MPDRLALDPADDDAKLLAQVVGYYHDRLKASPDALAYLARRGITHPATLDHFRLGFSDRSLGTGLPHMRVKAGAAVRSRLRGLGLFRGTGHEHFRGSVTVPIPAADGSGRVVNIYGRKVLDGRLRPGTAMHTFLDDARPGVWNVEAFGPAAEVIVAPSAFDALTFWHWGYRNVTATLGAVTPDLLAALAEFGIRRVLATTEGLVEPLLAAGVETFLVRLPPGLDVNGYAVQTADPADALGSLLRHAEWAGRGDARPAPIVVPAGLLERGRDAPDDLPDDDDEGEPEPAEDDCGEVVEPDPDEPPAAAPVAPLVRSASPLPAVPPPVDVAVTDAEVVMTFGSRKYRVRGLDRNQAPDVLRVNLLAANGVGMFVDQFDLYAARHRAGFVSQAAAEMGLEERVVKGDLGRVLLKLEELQDAALAVKAAAPAHPAMTPDDRSAALAFLSAPGLLDRVAGDFAIAGGRANLLTAYLGAISRKLDHPLSVLIQSTSAAGKTTLMDAVLDFCPPEDVVRFSAMTGQSLYYMSQDALTHKVLAVAEEAGATKASYALKLLASEGELRIASTGKDAGTGRLVTQEYVVTGPTSLFTSTTSGTVDEELANRCLVLTVDESADLTREIHRLQRERRTLEGLVASRARDRVRDLHRNAQRLLRPLLVVNPWATRLTFPSGRTRTRRDHQKYLGLIDAVALLHQHQRPVKSADLDGRPAEYVEATPDDVRAANDLAAAVLGRSMDELPPQTRNLLELADEFVRARCERDGVDRADCRFTRRELREFTAWGDTQTKVHLRRLADLEYVVAHRDRQAKLTRYELAYVPNGSGHALPGLIDPDLLRPDSPS